MNRLIRISTIIVCITLLVPGLFLSPARAQSDAARDLNRKGVIAITSGHHQEAIQHLKQAMQMEPTWAEPYYNAFRLLRLRNKRDDMMKALRKAVSLEPENDKYVDTLVGLLKEELQQHERRNNRQEVTRLRQEIISAKPGDLETGLQIVNEHLAANRQEKATDLAEQLLEKNAHLRTSYNSEEMGMLFMTLAKGELQRNNLTTARSHADNATKYSTKNPDAPKALVAEIREKQNKAVSDLLEQAKQFSESGSTEKAIATLNRAAEILPNSDLVMDALEKIKSSRDARQSMDEARNLAQKGSWLEARDLLEFVVSIEGENAEAKRLLDQAVQTENDLIKKLGRAGKLPRSSSERLGIAEGFYRRGKQFLDAGNKKDAAIALNRGMSLIELDRGLIHLRPKFEEELSKIDETDRLADLWKRGVEARNNYEYEESLKLLSQLPTTYNVQLQSYLAEAYWKTGNEEKALQSARYQLSVQEDNNRAKFVIGSIFLEQGNKDMAYNYFKEIFDIDPDYPEVKDKLLASSTAKWKKYLPVLILVLLLWTAWALYKNLPEYNKNAAIKKANSFLKKEMYDECIDEITKVRRSPILTPFDGALISRILAQAFLKKGYYDKAVGECKHLISINPKDEDAHTWLGYAYLGRRMISPESLPELLNLYKKDSRNIALVSLLGSHYTQQKNLSEDGVQILEQWLNLDPNNPEVLKPLGRYYLKKNRSDDKSMKVFQKMMEFGSPEDDFLLGVAKIHLKLRQFESCLQLCEQVINSDVNNELVHSVLREVYHKQNKLPELLEIYGNFLQNNPYNVAFQNGLKDAQKLAEQTRNSSPQPQQDDTTVQSDQIICPNCQHANTSRDYCCQQCGNNLC